MTMRHLFNSDEGASAIVIAFSMVLLLGAAALTVDVGAGFNERRLDQNSIDAAVLGGAIESFLVGDAQAVADQITDLADTNVGRLIPNTDWIACQDVDQLAITAADLGLTPASDCISFSAGYDEFRAKVPTQQVDTTFARVIGFDALFTSAFAEAAVEDSGGLASSPPFVVLAGTGSGEEICLRTSSSGPALPPIVHGDGPYSPPIGTIDPDPCDDTVFDPDEEFFGTLLPYAYEDPATGDVICDTNEVEYSIAEGIDHVLSEFEPDFSGFGDPQTKEEGVGCTGNPKLPQPYPNTMKLNTGLSAAELRCGMLSTGGGVCGSQVPAPVGPSVDPRLQRGTHVQNTYQFLTERMDNAPLWLFFDDGAGAFDSSNAPASCVDLRDNSGTWDYYDKKDALIDCLTNWTSSQAVLFDESILATPRFTFLPYLAEENLNAGPNGPTSCISSAAPQCVHFDSFVPVYIQALYSKFTGGQDRFDCDPGGNSPRWGIHQAGEEKDCGRNNDNLDRLTGVVFHCGMLPSDICKAKGGPLGFPGGTPVMNVFLTK